ncbi:MAG: (Fe-S)-binding protein [Planctomycetales bacterium]|nr:(Fe-S)-binding protein [Planctomycetales bacterium]
MKLQLMITCLGDVVRPAAGQATVRLLRRLGHEVAFPAAQTCCGQPLFNSGFAELARQQARHTIETFQDAAPVVVPSGSCAAMVKVEFPHLFADDPAWRGRAEELAARTFELSDFLVNQLGVVDVGARFDGTVAYHFACHLRMLNQQDEAVRLIENVAGATVVPLARQDQCCGFGGSFAVRYPEISGRMVDDKAQCIVATGADAVVSTDAGCLMNIGGRLHRQGQKVQVLHLAELLANAP